MKLIFEVGDVVRLKSGSPAMTVASIGFGFWGDDTVTTVWFEEGNHEFSSEKSYGALQRGEFAHEILKAVEEPRKTTIVDLFKLSSEQADELGIVRSKS